MRQIGILLLVLVMCCLSSNATGEPITDPSQLSPNPTIIDFESFNTEGKLVTFLTNPVTFGDITFSSLTGSLIIFDLTLSDWGAGLTEIVSKTMSTEGAEPNPAISIQFPIPVSEVLLGWGDPTYPGNFLLAYDPEGNLLESSEVDVAQLGAVWVGFKRPIADIAMVIVQPNQSDPSGDDYLIDNIHYNAPTTIDIDIKPGFYPNTINLGSKGSIPVAILTTADFAASTVAPSAVTFAGASPIERKMVDVVQMLDVDSDDDIDMVLYFSIQDLNLDMDSTEATLTGETIDGQQIVGTDLVNMVRRGKK
jgi:hypothetical protein